MKRTVYKVIITLVLCIINGFLFFKNDISLTHLLVFYLMANGIVDENNKDNQNTNNQPIDKNRMPLNGKYGWIGILGIFLLFACPWIIFASVMHNIISVMIIIGFNFIIAGVCRYSYRKFVLKQTDIISVESKIRIGIIASIFEILTGIAGLVNNILNGSPINFNLFAGAFLVIVVPTAIMYGSFCRRITICICLLIAYQIIKHFGAATTMPDYMLVLVAIDICMIIGIYGVWEFRKQQKLNKLDESNSPNTM